MRQLLRQKARFAMKRAGYTKLNKPGFGDDKRSYFAKHWREYV